MRAYLIAPGTGLDDGTADAVVIDGRTVSTSLRAAGEAIQGKHADVADVALDCFASLAMTGGGTPRILLRVEGIDAPDLDACLAGAVRFRPDAIVLPARHGREIAHLGSRLAVHEAEHGLPDGGIGIVAILSSADAVLAAASFTGASPRLRGLGWDAAALARQLGGPESSASVTSPHPPPPEVPQRSGGLEGGLQGSRGPLEPSFAARLRLASQDAGVGGATGARFEARGGWSPVLAHVRASVRLAAAAAGVEAIEAAYPSDDAEGFGAHVAAARRDGFGAMFARDPAQVRLIRGAP